MKRKQVARELDEGRDGGQSARARESRVEVLRTWCASHDFCVHVLHAGLRSGDDGDANWPLAKHNMIEGKGEFAAEPRPRDEEQVQ